MSNFFEKFEALRNSEEATTIRENLLKKWGYEENQFKCISINLEMEDTSGGFTQITDITVQNIKVNLFYSDGILKELVKLSHLIKNEEMLLSNDLSDLEKVKKLITFANIEITDDIHDWLVMDEDEKDQDNVYAIANIALFKLALFLEQKPSEVHNDLSLYVETCF
jgi:hypothetical protein